MQTILPAAVGRRSTQCLHPTQVEVALEGDHVFAAVRRDDVSQCWHGPWHLGHSKTCMEVPFDIIPEHSNCSINLATRLFSNNESTQLRLKTFDITVNRPQANSPPFRWHPLCIQNGSRPKYGSHVVHQPMRFTLEKTTCK